MTKNDITRMAREAGLADPMVFYAGYERFAALVAAHKAEVALAEAYRCGYEAGVEAAAVVCESVAGKYQHAHNASSENIADECAAVIRARRTT